MTSEVVIVETKQCSYPKESPFRPDTAYPEYPFPARDLSRSNHVYGMVREGLRLCGFDAPRYGAGDWNPLGHLIHPGDTVLLKPNMVLDRNRSGGGTDCLYTQPSVVAAVCDYAVIALKARGRIIIGDAPLQGCDFGKLVRESGYEDLIAYYRENLPRSLAVELMDFRGVRSTRDRWGILDYSASDVDNTVVDLGGDSEFAGIPPEAIERMRVTNYDPEIMRLHHNAQKHEYCVNSHVLQADVVINLPKPKTHRKAGVTAAMKNLVGIAARKEFLPHHTNGAKEDGGDEYLYRSALKAVKDKLLDRKNHLNQGEGRHNAARAYQVLSRGVSLLLKFFDKDHYFEGSWHGNDTISRTIADLNKILFHADKAGKMREDIQRRYFIVADMILSGEREGPLEPSPKDVGWIAMGTNPVGFDECIMTLMGANLEMIPTIARARRPKGRYSIPACDSEPVVISNNGLNGKKLGELSDGDLLHFLPAAGWTRAFAQPGEKR